MQDLQAVIFDLDGVIIDSEPIHDEAHRIVFRTHDLPVPETIFPSFKGITERKVFERVVSEFGTDTHDADALMAAKERVMTHLIDRMQPIPGALQFLHQTKRYYRVALTTSSTRFWLRDAFGRFGLDAFFEVIVTSEDVEHPKPHPQPYTTTTQRMGLDPSKCLVIEDSLHGVSSARAAGCHVAGMTTSFTSDLLEENGAHLTVDSFGELWKWLTGTGARSKQSPIQG